MNAKICLNILLQLFYKMQILKLLFFLEIRKHKTGKCRRDYLRMGGFETVQNEFERYCN